jgi:predicted site-specific integrase-resolvase
MYLKPKQAANYYKVSTETLRLQAISGKIKYITTLRGHHRYKIIPKYANNNDREKIIYGRVSSSKQKKDLDKQIKYIQQKFPKYRVIKDIGSGFNFERKGFISLLDSIMHGKVKEVVVAHNDRLTRIGFNFILHICKHYNTKLTVLSNKEHRSAKREFTEEFISVITYYTSKFYGLRKYNLLSQN